MQAQILDRAADRAPPPFRVTDAQRPAGHVHGRLGDSIHVDEGGPFVAVALEPGAQRRRLQPLAAEDHQAQGRIPVRSGAPLGPHQREEGGRGLVEDRDPLPAQEIEERLGGSADQVRDDDEPAAVQQGAPHLPDREVEGAGMEQRPDIGAPEIEPRARRLEQPDDVPVRDHDPLGAAGRAGRVDDVGRVFGAHSGLDRRGAA